MVLILDPEQFDDWLDALAHRSMEFLQAFPVEGAGYWVGQRLVTWAKA